MKVLLRLHVWQIGDKPRRVFYGEKTVDMPVCPEAIDVHNELFERQDFDLCYDVAIGVYTVDLECHVPSERFDDYVGDVRNIGFADPAEADEE